MLDQPRSILWGHWLPLVWPLCNPPHRFQSQSGSLTCTCTCMHMVNLRVMSGATCAFSTNRGVHCISMYIAAPTSRHPSCKQWRAGNGGLLTWAAVRFKLGISGHLLDKWACYPLGHAYSFHTDGSCAKVAMASLFVLFSVIQNSDR